MTSASPQFGNPLHPNHGIWFLFLVVVIAVIAGYVISQFQRRRRYKLFAQTELLDSIAPQRPRLIRYLPAAALVVGLVFLTVALTGPTAMSQVAKNQSSVILVMDISESMRATDIKPSRIDAARKSALKFVEGMAPTVQLGVVTFAGTAQPLLRPSTDHDSAKKIIDQMLRADKLEKKSATGEGLFAALQQIESIASAFGGQNQAPPARIVLVSDGKQTVPDDLNAPRGAFVAARTAKEKHIPICTIGFGTSHGKVTLDNREQDVKLDEDSLRKISTFSNSPGNTCQYFSAESQTELSTIYQSLNESIGYEKVRSEASRLWALCGTVCIAAAAGASFLLNRGLP